MIQDGCRQGARPIILNCARRLLTVIPFPMVCALKIDHGVQKGENALGYATKDNLNGCNKCHSRDSAFWKYLGYSRLELLKLKAPRTPQ